jgi:hypothetical protein
MGFYKVNTTRQVAGVPDVPVIMHGIMIDHSAVDVVYG